MIIDTSRPTKVKHNSVSPMGDIANWQYSSASTTMQVSHYGKPTAKVLEIQAQNEQGANLPSPRASMPSANLHSDGISPIGDMGAAS